MADWHDGNPPPLPTPPLPELPRSTHPPRVLMLYGSLRERSYSRLLAEEAARLLEGMGCEVRWFHAHDLPVKAPGLEDHPEVVRLRELSLWSEAQVWSCPELHGTITGVFKNQIDWIPLSLGAVRPTQGPHAGCHASVNGGSQSFNVVNTLRDAWPLDAHDHHPESEQRGQGLPGVSRRRAHEGLPLSRPRGRRHGGIVPVHAC